MAWRDMDAVRTVAIPTHEHGRSPSQLAKAAEWVIYFRPPRSLGSLAVWRRGGSLESTTRGEQDLIPDQRRQYERRWHVLIERNGKTPRVHASARIASSASVVGNVEIGAHAYVNHGVVIESSGPLVEIGEEVILFSGAIVRSVGGSSRPAFPVRIGKRTLVSPLCVLTGCEIGSNCYVATGAIVLQGATVGDHVRVGAGAIVHATTVLPDRARVGMRHLAVPTADGFLSTGDVEQAREIVAGMDFFETAFGAGGDDQVELHAQVMSTLLDEVHAWQDEPLGQPERQRR
jgi:carbonic anhydrase/acetyltransferase-like protein (isoleucine patch superfamily)